MDGIRRMQGGFNTVQGMLNMPNNIITGAIRAGLPRLCSGGTERR